MDHALNITVPSISSSLEKALGRALKSFERACSDISQSITLVGYAAAAYLVMSGVSKLIEARNSNKRLKSTSCCDDDDGDEEHQKKNTKRKNEENTNNKDCNANKQENNDTGEGGVAKDKAPISNVRVPDRTAYFAPQHTTTMNTMVGGEMNNPDPTASFSQIYNIPP